MAENLVETSKGIKRFESWGSTLINVVRLRYTWTINNFSFCSEKNGENLKSPTFSARSNGTTLEWVLELYPKGHDKGNDEAISLFLTLVNGNLKEIQAKFTLGIVNNEGKDFRLARSLRQFEKEYSWGCENFANKYFLFKEETKLLSDDKLIIFCEIVATVGSVNFLGTLTTPRSDLVENLAFMLENEECSDVTLSTSGKEFRVHKLILGARSPVFKAMFQQDMVESRSNRVEITDIDEEVLGEMLRYMYTGEIHKLKQMAPRLLGVAEKYGMDDLKITCEKALFECLSLENAAEIFILSDTFRAATLKDQVKSFIVAHSSDVGNTSEFQAMVQTHPHLGMEAFHVLSNSSIV